MDGVSYWQYKWRIMLVCGWYLGCTELEILFFLFFFVMLHGACANGTLASSSSFTIGIDEQRLMRTMHTLQFTFTEPTRKEISVLCTGEPSQSAWCRLVYVQALYTALLMSGLWSKYFSTQCAIILIVNHTSVLYKSYYFVFLFYNVN